jgi:hypothetical protein
VVTVGKNFLASRMKDATAAVMSHMAIGTGAVAPAVGDTVLAAENARQALLTTNVAGAAVTYASSFGVGIGTGTITEAGLFSASVAGTMLARTTFAAVVKAAGDILNVTWTVTVGSVAVI